jgi:flagellar biosynthetic protein FlhB
MADSNKTEKPTPQRQKKARERGQVARSRELSGTLACVGGLAVFFWQAPGALAQWRHLMQASLDLSAQRATVSPMPLVFWTSSTVVRCVLPSLLCAFGCSLLLGVMQGGLVFAPEALKPDIAHLNPANKVKQIFSITGLSGLLKSLLPFAAMAYLAYGTVMQNLAGIVHASEVGLRSSTSLLLSMTYEIGWKSALVLVAWSGIDYFLVWRKLNSDLMMSREELRQEMKENDGDPFVKGRIRRLQRQMRQRQMMKDVEKATVVVTNPTHYAIALRYEADMAAPLVVAKGLDMLAEKIKTVARWQGIAIVENVPLAHALYRSVEIGQSIPAKLYTAVAEILAMVYRAQAQVRNQGPRR